jgi:hypothetical protein
MDSQVLLFKGVRPVLLADEILKMGRNYLFVTPLWLRFYRKGYAKFTKEFSMDTAKTEIDTEKEKIKMESDDLFSDEPTQPAAIARAHKKRATK